MEYIARDRILKVMAMTRFHFVAGLPLAGGDLLCGLLSQNPRFMIGQDGRALSVFSTFGPLLDETGAMGGMLDPGQRAAIMRGVLDGIYNDRPLESVIFDLNHSWLTQMDRLAQLYPLSRFLVPVRNPAMMAEHWLARLDASAGDHEALIAQAFGADGQFGSALDVLRNALHGRHSERMLLVDQDRLLENPTEAMRIIYHFLREEEFEHDFDAVTVFNSDLGGGLDPEIYEVSPEEPAHLLTPREAQKLSGKAFWRNVRRTNATMMLRHAPGV